MKRFEKKGSKVKQWEHNYVRKNYCKLSMSAIAKNLHRSEIMVSYSLKVQGLKVPEKILQQHIADSRFKKNHVPFCKGKKRKTWMSPEGIAVVKKNQFKKGQHNHNEKYDGAISIRPDKRGMLYKLIRISKANWQPLQRVNWEKEFGKIQKGCVLRCVSEDTLNCETDNWELITQWENSYRNSASTTLPDKYVAAMLATKNNPELIDYYMQFPQVIASKRKHLLAQRQLKQLIV